VIGVVKCDDGSFLGGIAGYFYGVLHRFGTAVHEQGGLGEGTRHQTAQFFRQFYGNSVRHHHKAGMGEFFSLIFDSLHHFRVAVPDIHDCNAAGKIDVIPAIDIGNHRPSG